MKKGRFLNKENNQKGTTLIEVLVATVIILIIILIISRFMGFLLTRPNVPDKITAMNLAKQEMELSLLSKSIENEEKIVVMNRRQWKVNKIVTKQDENLYQFIIDVYKGEKPNPAYSLKSLKYIVVKE